ncbi:mechanosensitive ion channel family protein [Camelimonas abortus]|uniref:Mechanosensitive ion channel family protein n=1 Tax=Camelimonas abortus TaxID=1017184 RepID=A0ABV7LE99_9HYPH
MAGDSVSGDIENELGAFTEWLNQLAAALHAGVQQRLAAIAGADREWAEFVARIQAEGRDPGLIIFYAAVAAVAGGVLLALGRRFVAHRRLPLGPALRGLLAICLAGALVVAGSRLVTHGGELRRLVILWGCTAIVALACRNALHAILSGGWAPPRTRRQLRMFRLLVSASFIWAIGGLAALSTLRGLGAGSGLQDLFSTVCVSLPATAMFVGAYAGYGRAVTAAVAGPPPRTAARLRFAAAWPALAIFAVLGTLVAFQVSITLRHPLPGLPMMLTLLLLLLAPHVDSTLAAWARAREQRCKTIPRAAACRTSRPAFIMVTLLALGWQWAFPALAALGVDASEAEARAVWLALTALAAAWAWNLTDVAFERLAQRKPRGGAPHDAHAAQEEGVVHRPQSRLETLFPLLAGTARTLILLVAALAAMLLLGMNVWPVITGLSVFGLAISFGSQTLVKDIVSGLFFLIDDAFRMGEYIETSGAKGTVERISIRSVSLRHPRGAVATIPYGQIGKIQNYSRDWVIEKLVFRVAFDTDVEKVRKIFKQIGAKLAADPEFAGDLLQPFKSQGIAAVEDGTLLVRGKFMARAGRQFGVRKRVYLEVQQAFRENGIVAVPKPVLATVPHVGPAAGVAAAGALAADAPRSDASPAAAPARATPAEPASATAQASADGTETAAGAPPAAGGA